MAEDDFSKRTKKGWKNEMKNEKALTGSISILIGVVIAILALIRGPWQTGLLIAAFSLWGIWVVLVLLVPYMNQAKRRRERQLRKLQINSLQKEMKRQEQKLQKPSTGPEAGQLLLRHVNHRISAYLHVLYPKATWEWCEKSPADLALAGGVGRIRLYGVPEYDHGDVHIDTHANIRCDLVKIVPLSQDDAGDEEIRESREPVDPQVWFELQGRKIMEETIADLDSKGHDRLLIRENGDITVRQEEKENVVANLPGFPERVYWDRLLQVLEGNGLSAQMELNGILVSW